MARTVMAKATPAVLKWARTSAGLTVEKAAEKLGVEVTDVVAWEAGQDQLTISKLRRVADLYKRPLALLYLPEPPAAFQPMHDFRRVPEAGGGQYSPELIYEMRLAHQRRYLALEMMEEDNEQPPHFALTSSLNTNPEVAGQAIREALGVTYALQASWRDPRVAFHAWRSLIEDLGVLVFQASRFESAEASGFAYFDPALPFVVVNRKDVWGRRVFSLLHELAHLMLHQTGVSDVDAAGPRTRSDERVEVFCNKVAAAALLPKAQFLSEPSIAEHEATPREWSDAVIGELARTFSVSREAVVRRLLTFGRATEEFYGRKRAQYAREYELRKQRDKEQRGDKGIPRNMPREAVGDIGKPLVRMVLSQYHSERISLAEVSGYLGVKTRHVPNIEQTLVGG